MPTHVESTQNVPADTSVKVVREIETSDGYILVGQFAPEGLTSDQVQLNGDMEIKDANGKKVRYTFPQDINQSSIGLDPSESYWYVQFKADGLAYPLTMTFSGYSIRQADPGATAEFTFDAGPNPQPGQKWTMNQDIQIAGHSLRLVSIMVDSRNGYQFSFRCDSDLVNADLEILGYQASGRGGGGSGANGTFDRQLSYEKIPSGVLTVRISNLTVTGDSLIWKGQWSPATPRTDLLANPTPKPGLCLDADTAAQLGPAPANLASGKALVYEQLEGSDQWGLVLYNLAGGQKQVVTSSGNWGALSRDGSKVAYSAFDNTIHIVDVDTQAEQILQKASGFDLHWSPDGKQIAYVALGGGVIDSVFIVSADGGQPEQVSNLSYELVVGWSPDGAKLYFVAPFTGGAAWKLYSFDAASGVTSELFTIENGTPTFLNPKLSPDGQWIAYRGRDSGSLYLARIDGSDTHMVLENVGIDGIEWLSSGWLGGSLVEPNTDRQTLILVKPDSCEAYRLLEMGGEMEGLFIP
jgi:WD40 repeat protein